MSFGFSAGDFVTCLILIKNVVQALNDSTGSVADFKALMRTLKSLEHGLVTSEVVYQQWEKLDIAPEFRRNTVAMTNGIHFERQQCKEILERFIKSLTPYTDAFVKGRGMALIRQVKKVTWTFRRDEVGKLDRDLEGHLKTLRMYTEALFQIQMADNAKTARATGTKVNDILSSIIDLRADITSISATIRSGTAKMPFGLGYPWERSAALAENVLLHDAIGRKVLLPMMLLSTPSILHEILIVMYRGVPGRRRILRKQYTITDEDADGVLVEETNWSSVIHEGMQLSLNIVLPASSSWNIHRCPRCDEPALGNTLHDQRRRCHKCQLTFRIFDRERVIEEPESQSTTDPKADEPESQHEARVATSRKSASSKDSRRIGRSMKKDDDDDDHFKLVHYFRDVQISKVVPTIDTIPEDERIFEINDLPPLHQAAAKGLVADIIAILSSGEDVNIGLPFQMVMPADKGGYRFSGCAPLHFACYFDKIKAIDILLAHGANIGALDSDGAGVVTYAICGESRGRIVLPLISRGADVNIRDHLNGEIPLHFASELGIAWLIHVLVERGSDLDDRSVSGETPLHRAAKWGHAEVVQVLLEEGAEVQVTETADGLTPLHCASYLGFETVVNVLLQHDANITDLDPDGDTPLHLACMKGHEGVIKALLAHGANISARNNKSRSPLHTASTYGKKAAVQLLLDSGADILAANKWKESAIFKAAWRGHHEIVQLLLDRGADATIVSEKLLSPLMGAAHHGYDSIAELLIENGAKINEVDKEGCSPLHNAARSGHVFIAKLLLDHGAEIAIPRNDGSSPLICAARKGHEAVTQLLLDSGADIEASRNDGSTPLICAAKNGHEAVTRLLLYSGADVTAKRLDERTALRCALHFKHEAIANLLLEQGADATTIYTNGWSPLHYASFLGFESTVELLLQHGAEISAQDVKRGETPLHAAALVGNEKIIKMLLDNGAEIHHQDLNRHTALMNAARHGHESSTKLLIERGASVNHRDNDGRSVLHMACYLGHVSVVELLLDRGAETFPDKTGDTPLHEATLNGSETIVKLLLQYGVDANVKNDRGLSALITAVMIDSPAVTKLLMGGGLDPEAACYKGKSALFVAVALRRPKIVEIVLKDESNIILCNEDGVSPWSFNSLDDVKCIGNILEILLRHGWNKNEQDAQGLTFLHRAASDGSEKITQLLINLGCDLYVRNKGGDIPLHLAVLRKHHSIATLFLKAMKDDERFDQSLQDLVEGDSLEASLGR